uniref:HMG box domain-containing protein n=1 Tax=Strigops habroptila TaxID=2489341 RepID=A0A672UVK0_STRHB
SALQQPTPPAGKASSSSPSCWECNSTPKRRTKPETSREISKKRSGRWKTISRKGKKNSKKAAKHRRQRRSKKKASRALRGVRKMQRRRQRKRVSFTIDKQPLSPFFLFMAKNRPKLQRSNPQLTAVETAKTLGKMWHEQSQSDREMYREQLKGKPKFDPED